MADDLQRYLKNLSNQVHDALAKEIEDIAEDLAGSIRDAAPVGKTGRLKASVQAKPGRNDLEYVVEAGGDLTTKEVRQGSGQPSDYALHVEYGTVKMPAQPFFYPTVRAKAQKIQNDIRNAVADALSKT